LIVAAQPSVRCQLPQMAEQYYLISQYNGATHSRSRMHVAPDIMDRR
jgi:hypothetical protein